MESLAVSIVAFIVLAIKGLVSFTIVYGGARLAIRHERGLPN